MHGATTDHRLRACFAAACMLFGAAGCARVEAMGVAWDCVQEMDERYHVLCVPRPAGAVEAGAAALPVNVHPARLPGGPDTRPVALRGAPEVFSAAAWRVPLYARPADAGAVTRLLESVLCGEATYCMVRYGARVPRIF
jgi:hypothetical protein